MKYIPFLFGAIFLASCFPSTWDVSLILANETNQRIRYFYEIKNMDDINPDTTLCSSGEFYWRDPQSEKAIRSQTKWSFLLRNKILRIFIISEDSLSKYGQCDIMKKQIFSKRFDLTYDDLEKMKWKVIYND